jgi:SOS response regulatory protein OraA/RecX
MIERLERKGFGYEETERAVRYLQERGFIEDRALASELFTNAVERKYLGRTGIRAFLGMRGIDKELINETLSIHTRDMEMESAGRLVKKRLKALQRHPKEVKRRRIRAALQRRGFSAEVIRMAVKYVV